MGKFILGVLVTLIVLAIGVYCFFALGLAPVATASPAMPFEKKLAKLGLNKRIEKEMPKNPPNIQMDDTAYQVAANFYKDDCAFCHGLPNQQRPRAATGMYPPPPQLFQGKGVTDDEPGETYWKVANGIRLTGMPAYKPSRNDQQLWQVTMLLKNADKLPVSAQQVLGGAIGQAAPAKADDADHEREPKQ
jgi:thiosulfate dehydrogenase